MLINNEEEYQQLAASERFQRSRDEYVASKLRLVMEPVEVVDTPERVAVREDLLDIANTVGQEAHIGANDLVSINYLTKGQRTAQSVCRITVRDTSGDTMGYGTGFLVSPTLLLTNHHVLSMQSFAVNSLAEFDYEFDGNGLPKTSKTFQLDPARFFYNNRDLDFALVAVKPVSIAGAELSQLGYLKMILQSGKVLIDEPVTIIQHPGGKDKRIAMRNNRVMGLTDGFIHYETDTEPGSSGSPVVNDQWQVAALHHAGVPRKNSSGQVLTKDGHIWQPKMDRSEIDWIANEGVRISAICNHLREKTDWTPTALEQINAVLSHSEKYEMSSVSDRGFYHVEVYGSTQMSEKIHTVAPPISLHEFYALVDDENSTEADLAPYLCLDSDRSDAFAPAYNLNGNLVVDATTLEGEVTVAWLNDWSRRRRSHVYHRKLASNQPMTKIVAEGDSWFQFPILLDDVIDHLTRQSNLAILCLGAAGDLLSSMIARAEYLDAIKQEKPEFFLFSGGGNDLVGGGRLAEMLHPFQAERTPENYLNTSFHAFEAKIRSDYVRLFKSLQGHVPHILCHGYDYVVPNGGKWLGKPMATIGITEPTLQKNILHVIIDRMNHAMKQAAQHFSNVTLIDVRNTVPATGWFDELHPSDREFGLIADKFASTIDAVRASSPMLD